MFCKNCGSNVGEDSVFCSHCGTQVREHKTTVSNAPSSSAAPTNFTTPSNSSSQNNNTAQQSSNAVALVGFILALVSAMFGFIGLVTFYDHLNIALIVIALIMGIAAIVCSGTGMNIASRNNGRFRGFAIAGLVVSIVVVSLAFLIFIVGLSTLYRYYN